MTLIQPRPQLVDDDMGEISVRLNGAELQSWTYADGVDRRVKMACAEGFQEGVLWGWENPAPVPGSGGYATELTPEGEQLVIPGCERSREPTELAQAQSTVGAQWSLFYRSVEGFASRFPVRKRLRIWWPRRALS